MKLYHIHKIDERHTIYMRIFSDRIEDNEVSVYFYYFNELIAIMYKSEARYSIVDEPKVG